MAVAKRSSPMENGTKMAEKRYIDRDMRSVKKGRFP
jgi:hypothetical protein